MSLVFQIFAGGWALHTTARRNCEVGSEIFESNKYADNISFGVPICNGVAFI